ncbi:type III secretion system cytoplasmic ring protein SctQ [Erwinia oleae]|uniref:type III secretion system cytoplasmic ring protein SctQ n=1 Tax=Erwinia oleae TaxID=796334 RepID=UPI0006892219|nr:type III secretion system cytoplasmic ring protein SctQ [Erwinia oleae]
MSTLLRNVSASEARVRERLGGGLFYHYTLDGEPGVLRLALAEDRHPTDLTAFRCEAGAFALSEPEPVLALMSTCPGFAAAPQTPEQAWYWPWWNQQLSFELLALFGHLSVETENAGTGDFLLSLTLEWGTQRAQSLLALSSASLSLLLDKSGWQQDASPLPESMMLTLPMIIGELVLSPAGLQSLRCGDVVLPDTQWFTPDGRGTLRGNGWHLQGELQMQPGEMAHFYLSETERINVTLTPDEFEHDHQHHSDPQWDDGAAGGTADFTPLPLSLSVRCGQLKLTLGELSTLTPGAMVMIENVTPGEAVLCHGDYPLAKGELVDVEGRLGLQITHVLPVSKNPMNGGAW